jgi:hypothetical protein
MSGSDKENIFFPVAPDPGAVIPEIERIAGYPDGIEDEMMLKNIQGNLDLALKIINPVGVFKSAQITDVQKDAIITHAVNIESRMWANLVLRVKAPEIVCFFAVTIGQEFDRKLAALQETSLFNAYLFNAAGSVLVDKCAEQIERYIGEKYKEKGLRFTARFSPGYCDWELCPGQGNVFNFLEPEAIGIELLHKSLMTPEKSITAAVIGASEVPLPGPCAFCGNRKCPHRRG